MSAAVYGDDRAAQNTQNIKDPINTWLLLNETHLGGFVEIY